MAITFLIFGLFVMLTSLLAFHRNRSTRKQKSIQDDFWNRENEANFVRRKDISNLPYINIPFETFSIGAFADNELSVLEQQFLSFRDKKMLYLGNLTNTDLKMQYGPANLAVLSEYDTNYADMLISLNNYVNRLIELGHLDAAIPALEFAVASGSDMTVHFVTLAGFYKEHGFTEKLAGLKMKAEGLESLMRNSILAKMDEIVNE